MKLTVEEHLAPITEALGRGEGLTQIADRIGCHRATVRAFVKVHVPEARSQNGSSREAVPDFSASPSEDELLRAEMRELRAAARKDRSVDVQAERLAQDVRDSIQPAAVRYEPPERAEGHGRPHVHVLLLSDLHIGEVVEPEAVNGLNSYSWDIFTERMASIQRALRSFQNNRPYPIDELLIALLGDNVSNSHHKELADTNEFPITEQCFRGGMFLAQWIEALVEDYPRIRVVGVGGNHGRVDHKPSSKQVFDSFDWLGYQYIDQHLKNYETVECHFPRSGMTVEQVAGRNMLLWHGDGVRSSMPGVPWGGVMRRWNELRRQYGEQGVLLDYVALGHFHQANVVQGSIFMNGSVMGLNEYGLKNFGSGERPTQLLLTFDKERRRLTDISYITP